MDPLDGILRVKPEVFNKRTLSLCFLPKGESDMNNMYPIG